MSTLIVLLPLPPAVLLLPTLLSKSQRTQESMFAYHINHTFSLLYFMGFLHLKALQTHPGAECFSWG